MNSASARASSVLPTPVGPEEQERADRAVGILQPGARAAQGAGHRADRLVLADHPLVQPLLHVDELLDLALHQAGDRDAGPLGDDLGHVLGVDHVLEEPRCRARRRGRVVLGGLGLRQALLELGDRAVLKLGRAAEVGLALGALELDPRLLEPLLDIGDRAQRLLLTLPLGVHPGRRLALLGQRPLELLAARRGAGIVIVAE